LPILQLQHHVSDFDAWAQMFLNSFLRHQPDVPNYRVLRPVGEPNSVIVEFELDGMRHAEGLRVALRDACAHIEAAGLVTGTHIRMLDVVSAPPRANHPHPRPSTSLSRPLRWRRMGEGLGA
jgi:hypothetical protein